MMERRSFLRGLGLAPIAITAPNVVLGEAPLAMSLAQKERFVDHTQCLWTVNSVANPSPALEKVQRLTYDFYRDWGLRDTNDRLLFYANSWAEGLGLKP